MRAWRVHQLEGPEAMRLEDLPPPRPGPRQALVRVEAAALNFLDTLVVRGQYQVRPELPFTPGVELAGEVLETGPGSRLRPGQRVCGLVDFGAFAEQAVVDDDDVVAVPDGLDSATAATIPVVYPTAYCGLKLRAGIREGDTVLVHAGAGGVGLATIHLARAWGARVIATAGGEAKLELCRQQGAELAVDYNDSGWVQTVREHVGKPGVDIVMDIVGGQVTEDSLRCMGWGGRLLIVGFAAGGIPQIPANRLLLKNLSAMGVIWGEHRKHHPEVVGPTFDEIFSLLQAGRFAPVISARYPLDAVPDAIRALGSRATTGKVIIEP